MSAIKDLITENQELREENERLKKQLEKFNPKLKPNQKLLDYKDTLEIKELHKKYSYREISKMKNISICTISKVINNEYPIKNDKK